MGARPDEPGLAELQGQMGRRLRALRQARRWTQEEAADHAGLGWRRLQAIEAGDVNLQLRTIVRLARVYGVEVLELFTADVGGTQG